MSSPAPSHPLASAALLALATALMLAACGGDGESGDDAAAVRKDITTALTSTKKEDCEADRFATQKFVDQQTYKIAELAKEVEDICRDSAQTYAADSVTVTQVKIDGDRATANVDAEGGAYGFGDLDVELVKDKTWKLDELTGIEVDREKFNELQVQFASVGEGPKATKKQVDCTVRRLGRYDDPALERAIVKSDIALVTDPLLVCFLRPQLLEEGLPAGVVSCVLKALDKRGAELMRVSLAEDEKKTEELFTQAAAGCGDTGSTA